MNRFSDRMVLVTGGTRGIGFGCVRAFLHEGARVAFCGRSQGGVDHAFGQLKEWITRERVLGAVADVRDEQEVQRFVQRVDDAFGGIDILVNNAGTGGAGRLSEISTEEWDRVVDTNLRGVFLFCRACLPLFTRRGGGCVINVSSVAGQSGGLVAGAHYAAAKAGVLGLTKALATQLAQENIRVNAVAPADIDTDMTRGWPQSVRDMLISRTPLSRFGTVDEVVSAILFLASDEAGFVTGATLSINGGLYMT